MEFILNLVPVDRIIAGGDQGQSADYHQRRQQMIGTTHFADDDQGCQGGIGHSAEKGGHADDDIGCRLKRDMGKVLLGEKTHRTSEHAADKKRRSEDSARTTAGDGTAGGQYFEYDQH